MKQSANKYEWNEFLNAEMPDCNELFNSFVVAYAVDDSGNVTRWAANPLKTPQWATVVKNITDCTDGEIERLYQYYLTCDRDAIDDDIANYVCARKGLHRICGYSEHGDGFVIFDCLCGRVKEDYSGIIDFGEPCEPKEVANWFDEVEPRSAEEFAKDYTPKLNEYIQEHLNDEEL